MFVFFSRYLVLSYTDWDLHQYLMHLMTQKDSCDLCRHRKHNQRSTTSNEVQFVTSSNGDETKCCEQDELSMPQVQSFMFQIISGLHYLHRNGLMHRVREASTIWVCPHQVPPPPTPPPPHRRNWPPHYGTLRVFLEQMGFCLPSWGQGIAFHDI